MASPVARALWFVLAGLLVAPGAHAYCRKMSKSNVPASYDPTIDGCEKGGVPIYFASRCVDYKVVVEPGWLASKALTLAEATTIVEEEFRAWTTAACPTEFASKTTPDLELRNVDGTKGGCPGGGGDNEVRFMDVRPDHESSNASTLGVTRNSKRELSGVIEKSTTEIYPQAVQSADPAQLRGVVRHELGHFLGLAHSEIPTSVMYFQSESGAQLPGLTDDDIDGICDAYSKTHPVGAGCNVTTSQEAGPNANLFPFALVAGTAYLRLRRQRRRPILRDETSRQGERRSR